MLYVGDVDGDGLQDLAAVRSGQWVRLSSTGAHQPLPGVSSWSGWDAFAVGDLDEDGYDDVVLRYGAYDSTELGAFLGGPDGLSSAPLWTLDATRGSGFWDVIEPGRSVLRMPGSDRLVTIDTREGRYYCGSVVDLEVLADVGTPTPSVAQSWTPEFTGCGATVRIQPEPSGSPGPVSLALATEDGMEWFAWDASTQTVGDAFAQWPHAAWADDSPGPTVASYATDPAEEDWVRAVWGWTSPGGGGSVHPILPDDSVLLGSCDDPVTPAADPVAETADTARAAAPPDRPPGSARSGCRCDSSETGGGAGGALLLTAAALRSRARRWTVWRKPQRVGLTAP